MPLVVQSLNHDARFWTAPRSCILFTLKPFPYWFPHLMVGSDRVSLNTCWHDGMVKVTLKLQGKLYHLSIRVAWHAVQLQSKLDACLVAPQTRRSIIKNKWWSFVRACFNSSSCLLHWGRWAELWMVWRKGWGKKRASYIQYIHLYIMWGQEVDGWLNVDVRAKGMDCKSLKTGESRGWCRLPIILRGWQHTEHFVIEISMCVCDCLSVCVCTQIW